MSAIPLMLLVITGGVGLVAAFLLGRRSRRLEADTRGMAEQAAPERPPPPVSQERFEPLVERSPEALFIHREGTLVFHNPAAAALLGYERADELRGRKLAELILAGEEQSLLQPGEEQ